MQPLFRACGVDAGCRTVLDCTAGLLGDAMLLAGRGMLVTACERNAAMAARQRAMIEDWMADGATRDAASRITLFERDARDALREIVEGGSEKPDVVYIDPMHPARKKAALVKKDIREVREVVGGDEDAGELLAWGLLAAGRRAVVKWPRVGEGLEHRLPEWFLERPEGRAAVKPAGTVLGRATRWDVFTPRGKKTHPSFS